MQAVFAASPPWHSHRYNRAGYYRAARATASFLPRPARVWLATRVARTCAAGFPRERAAIRRNLARVCPHRDAAWLDAAVGRVFENFAVCFADLLSLNRGSRSALWRHVRGVDEQEPTRRALARGRGCVCLTAHLGNWALAGRLLALLGRPVHVVMAPEADAGVTALLDEPGDDGVRHVRLDGPFAAVGLVAALRRGAIVAFQVDRVLGGRDAALRPFFGQPAPFPLGPFLVAGAAGAPVVPAFCVLEPDGRYRLRVEAAVDVRRGAEALGLEAVLPVVERYVRAYWDQWFNFFDVWPADGAAS